MGFVEGRKKVERRKYQEKMVCVCAGNNHIAVFTNTYMWFLQMSVLQTISKFILYLH